MFLFLADFVILDIEEDENVPIILGRPFIATGKAQINVQEGELKLRVQGDEVTFHVFQAMKHPDDEANDNIIEPIHKESMHGDLVNCKDKISVSTKGVNGVGTIYFIHHNQCIEVICRFMITSHILITNLEMQLRRASDIKIIGTWE